MNEYLIKYKIATVAELVKPFDCDDYHFESYTSEWWDCNAWTVSRTIKANTLGEARFEFIKKLIPQIEKCSVVSECAFRFIANSYFIYKLTNNPEKIFFVYFIKDCGPSGLQFDEEQIFLLSKLKNISNQQAFMYIMEAANASTFYTRLTMLLSAAEALAGEEIKGKTIVTNHKELKRILGDSLHERLYKYGDGLRNKLLHGNFGAHELFSGLTDEVYRNLIEFLRSEFDIQIREGVVNPQRNFSDKYYYTQMFMKFKSDPLLDLNDLLKKIGEYLENKVGINDIFNYCMDPPTDY